MKKKIEQEPVTTKELILYRYCTSDWYPLIEHNLEIKTYFKDDFIFTEGNEVKNMKFIISGKVKVISREKDQEKIIRMAGEGDILGHRGLGSVLTYPVSAIALTDMEIYCIPVGLFLKLVKSNPMLSAWLINFLADELRKAERQSKILTQFNAKQRIVNELLHLSETFGISEAKPGLLKYTPTRKDLSNMAGTTYETVIRTLTELEKEEAIKLEGKKIALANFEKLKNYLLE